MARFMDKTLEEGYNIGRKEAATEIIGEIAEKLKFSNRIFKDCACNLVSPNYVDGRCDAYQEFIDILNGLIGKYFTEDKK